MADLQLPPTPSLSAVAPDTAMPAAGPAGAAPRTPWLFVPTLAFFGGIPNAIVMNVAVLIYKQNGFSNGFVGYISLLFIPWAARFLWAPLVDGTGTKRAWVVWTVPMLGLMFALLGICSWTVGFDPLFSLPLLALTAIIAATYDVAADGLYLFALDRHRQSAFSGIKVAFIRTGLIFAGGLLVKFGEIVGIHVHNPHLGWTALFGVLAVLYAFATVYHMWALPRPAGDVPVQRTVERSVFREAVQDYLKLPALRVIIAFLLLYRFGEGLLNRMIAPFLIDSRAVGGMGLTAGDAGLMQGTVGMIAMTCGGIFGGWLITRYGLRKMLLPAALFMTLPHFGYIYLAAVQPTGVLHVALPFLHGEGALALNTGVLGVIVLESFGYGIGFSSFFFFQCIISKGRFRTSFAAFSAGFMSVGWLTPNFLSGLIQVHIGYFWLFIWSVIAALPGILLVFALPIEQLEKSED